MIADLPPGWRGHYHAPFLGGGALFFALKAAGHLAGATLSDVSPTLIGTYSALRDHPAELLAQLQRQAINHGRAGKLHWRASRNRFNRLKRSDPFDPACGALLIYLQSVSFNGLYRENRQGTYNAPFDTAKKPGHIFSPARLAVLQADSVALQGVELRVRDFSRALDAAEPGALVFADPPYDVDDDALGHVSYVAAGFGPEEQVRLVDGLNRLQQRGAFVMATNSDTPRIRCLYTDWHRQIIHRPGTMSSRGDRRGRVPELLLRSWVPAEMEVTDG